MRSTLPKLVRDKVPDQIRSRGAMPKTRVASGAEYATRLHDKLREEVAEFLEAPSLEELADVLEVIRAIACEMNSNLKAVMDLADQKRLRLGGFTLGVILDSVEGPQGQPGPTATPRPGWESCPHEWNPAEPVCNENLGGVLGTARRCVRCGAVLHVGVLATLATPVTRIIPPEDKP